jgi:hypothetical protein
MAGGEGVGSKVDAEAVPDSAAGEEAVADAGGDGGTGDGESDGDVGDGGLVERGLPAAPAEDSCPWIAPRETATPTPRSGTAPALFAVDVETPTGAGGGAVQHDAEQHRQRHRGNRPPRFG